MPPQGDQDPIVEGGNEVPVVPSELTNKEIREVLMDLPQALGTQINLSMMPRANVVESTMTSRLRDFMRMNPPIFLGPKVEEDPQEFLDGVYKVLKYWGYI